MTEFSYFPSYIESQQCCDERFCGWFARVRAIEAKTLSCRLYGEHPSHIDEGKCGGGLHRKPELGCLRQMGVIEPGHRGGAHADCYVSLRGQG